MEVPVVLAAILQAVHVTTTLQSIPLQAAISLHPACPLPIELRR
ncbi:MAG TPA: hypothetical protein VFP89_10665 [Propionibacteriaceae bacterium]|nr:hypothetical protein [Propionibacteriaceae bacterium]